MPQSDCIKKPKMLWLGDHLQDSSPTPIYIRAVDTGYSTGNILPDQMEGLHFLVPHSRARVCWV